MEINKSYLSVFYISKYLALVPISVKVNANGELKIGRSILFSLYSIILGLTMISFLLKKIIISAELGKPIPISTKTFKMVIMLNTISIAIAYATTIGCGLFSLKAIHAFNTRLRKIDTALQNLPNFKQNRFVSKITSVIPIYLAGLIICFDLWIHLYDYKNDMKEKTDKGSNERSGFYFYVVHITLIGFQVLCANTACGLKRRFASLNMALKCIYLKDNNKFYKDTALYLLYTEYLPKKKTSIKTQFDHLKSITDHHKSLRKCVQIFMNTYGLAIVSCLLYYMFHIMAISYFLYLSVENGKPWIFRLRLIIWIVSDILKLLLLVEPCHMATLESQKTIQIIAEINRITDEPILEEEFWQQVLINKVEFSAMGVCTINRSLLTTITELITTYLAIFIQFRNMK